MALEPTKIASFTAVIDNVSQTQHTAQQRTNIGARILNAPSTQARIRAAGEDPANLTQERRAHWILEAVYGDVLRPWYHSLLKQQERDAATASVQGNIDSGIAEFGP